MRSLFTRLLIVAVACAIALVAAEVVLRMLNLAPTASVVTVNEEQFERIPGIFAPNQRLVDSRIPALPHQVSIDSLGYRGSHFPRRKPPGELRVLLAGDSFTYGDGVHDGQTIPAYLEQALRDQCRQARVINAGLPGAAIMDELAMIRRAKPLEPDVIVLLFSENDESQMSESSYWEALAANRRAKSRFPLSVLYPLLHNTALWNLALEGRAHLQARRARAAAERAGTASPAPAPAPQPAAATDSMADSSGGISAGRAALRRRYLEALRTVRDTLAPYGANFVFASFPMHRTITDSSRHEDAGWAVREAAAMGINSVDLARALIATRLPAESLYLLPHDGHGSARGHAVVAAALARHLVERSPALARCADAGADSTTISSM
ncbi:MAG TPA: SGNH/GDSL hydrolase family protein [Gemmatimonadaceae bacterium]|nr:SGNH/GDSL hydrolase family protein [Gemmatimonadaceae bacterium]